MGPLKQPKILVLSLEPPRMPGSGGEVRSFFFIKMLAEFGEITLVSLGGPSGNGKVGNDISQLCRKVIEPNDLSKSGKRTSGNKPTRLVAWLRALVIIAFPWKNKWKDFYSYCNQYLHTETGMGTPALGWRKRTLQSVLRTQYKIGARFFKMPPRSVFAYSDKFHSVEQQAVSEISNENYDVIWYEHTISYPFVHTLMKSIKASNRPMLVCNAHNIESHLYRRFSRVSTSRWDAEYTNIQARLLRKLEKNQFKLCDLIFVCSKEDKKLGQKLISEANIVVVGNGVDSQYFHSALIEPRARVPTLLFTGAFGYGANLDGLRYFVEDILPLIQATNPSCQFMFAGYDAQKAFEVLRIENDRVYCVSSPEDIRPCFRKAWVFVVPLRSGGGTRLKILEAMSMGCPIVSTRIGAEGIPVLDGCHLLLADTPSEFAKQVISLIDDPSLRLRLWNEASSWVGQNYDWGILSQQAAKEMNRLLNCETLPRPN